MGELDCGVHREQHEESGQEPQCSPHVEGSQRNRAVLPLLSDQDGRDQETAQDEEEIDPEGALGGPAEGMKCDDQSDSDGANAVERRPVAETPTHGAHYPCRAASANCM